MQTKYYEEVNRYYNDDAANFEKRYGANKLLQRIRESFREESSLYVGKRILEIGYGPGFDLAYYAATYPGAAIYGIDISDEMKTIAEKNVASVSSMPVQLAVGSIEDISDRFPDVQFDFIYVYFGALNTVQELEQKAQVFQKVLSKNGTMVITIINKYYLMLMLKNLVHGRFSDAFARLKRIWGGYSPYRHLESKCYNSAEVKRIFKHFELVKRRGYSILFPAWYEHKKFEKRNSFLQKTWKLDLFLNKTPAWQLGEYALYIFRHKNS
jgi:ubiquinone/menaquinone biosynthesis C-methylase UbiE